MEAINSVSQTQAVPAPISSEPPKEQVQQSQPAPPVSTTSSSSDENHIIDITG